MEYGGIAETLYNSSAATNNDQWAKAGDRFHKKRFVNPLASRRDELRGLHVNTHIPQVIAAARRYEISGDTRFHDVADYFLYEVSTRADLRHRRHQQRRRLAGASRAQLAAELKRSVATAECCCAYNMLKLTRHLYGWTGDPGYFDYYERSCSITASAPSCRRRATRSITSRSRPARGRPSTRRTSPSGAAPDPAWKSFPSSTTASTGTTTDGLFVNLFIPSELNWEEKGFKLRQETKFPEQQSTTLVVTAARPANGDASAHSRGGSIRADGEAQRQAARRLGRPRQLPHANRAWKKGDRSRWRCPCTSGGDHARRSQDCRRSFMARSCWPATWATKVSREADHRPQRAAHGRGNPNAPVPPNAPPRVPEIEIPTFTAAVRSRPLGLSRLTSR